MTSVASEPAATAAGGETPASRVDRLRLDYQQTTDLLRGLTDVRFKLLALVPTLSGTAVGLLGHPTSAVELLAIGVLGLAATLGVLLYELRNSELHDYAIRRARRIETALGFLSLGEGVARGGLFSERPAGTLRLFGVAAVDRDRALALVYGAALAGWTYLVAWGLLRALHVGGARSAGAVIGGAIGLLVLAELVRLGGRSASG
jgi:hypothetical protein